MPKRRPVQGALFSESYYGIEAHECNCMYCTHRPEPNPDVGFSGDARDVARKYLPIAREQLRKGSLELRRKFPEL